MKRLSCQICGRQEVWGVLSSHAWGHTPDGNGRVCPTCATKQDAGQDRGDEESRSF